MTEPTTPTTPAAALDPRVLLGSLKASLIGYAATVGAGVLATTLVVIAVADGSTSTAGVTQDDTTAIGFLVGLPFQLAGLSLFGALHLGDGGFDASVSILLLTLTAVFCLTTYVMAKRTERRQPATNASERLISSAITGVAMAVIVLVVTRLFAMRYDGTTTHTAGVGLFFGTLTLTTACVHLGRMRARGVRLSAYVHREYAGAMKLWLQHLTMWTVVFLPVAFVWTWVQDSFALALSLPIWGLNLAGFGYALGHLSAITSAGHNEFAWDIGLLSAGFLIVLSVVVSDVAAAAWHLRRGSDPERLAEPMSWAPLPLVWAAGGLLVWLIPSVHGNTSLAGGSIGPAFFIIFILAVWGLLIEVASRQTAPTLIGSLPEGVRALLARGAVQDPAPTDVPTGTHPTGSVPVARAPLTSVEKKRLRRLAIAMGALAVLGVAGVITVAVLNSTVYGPKHEADAYLDSIVNGDLNKTLELGPVSSDSSDALLTKDVLDQASAKVTGYKVTKIEKDGGSAEVSVTLRGLDKGSRTTFTLKKSGSMAVLFDKWAVSDGGLMKSVDVSMPVNADQLTIGTTTANVDGDSSYWMLPGTYDLDPYGDSKWITTEGEGTVVSPSDNYVSVDLPDPAPSQALLDEVNRQVDAYLAKCIASTEAEPDGCPNQTYIGTDVRKLKWTLTQQPTADLAYFDGTFPADLDISDGSARVTYEEDESYGFGAPDWTEQAETSDLYFSGSVDLHGDTVTTTFGD